MNASGDNVEYSEAVMVWCICMLLHYYPAFTKDSILDMTNSEISTYLEMVGLTKNPE